MADQKPRDLADARLRESGISAAHARMLRLEPLGAEAVARLDPSFKSHPALRIPYFDVRGRANGFYRLRYLGEMNGFDALRSKRLRYVQAPGTEPGVYLPPLADWPKLSKDPNYALFVTEGEFKSAKGCAEGFPTIGLGGVWSWKSAKRALPFLPVLDEFEWKGRRVYMVFDSDFSTNPDVMRALVAFSKELSSRGASPSMVSLPDLPDLEEAGKKTGLDDYLVREGSKRLAALVEDAEPFEQAEELWRLNGEVVYIRDPGLVVVLDDGRKMAPGAFKEHAYANRHYHEVKFDAKGNQKLEKKPLAPAWLQWEQRGELGRITYAPGQPVVTAGGEYNYWRGWGAEPRRGDVSLWRMLLDYAFKADAEARRWFERWCAFPIQHPGTKMYCCAVLWGRVHGTGKSLIGYSLGDCYGRNFKEVDDDAVEGGFNEWAENRQFVMGDDITGTEYKRATMETIKRMVTRQTLTVNAKYMPTYEVPDVINYLFNSNHPDSFIIEDTDRRYFVWEMPEGPLARSFYDEYDAWRKSGALAPALLHHLMTLDLGDFNPRAHAMDTPAKRAMMADGLSEAGEWCRRLREHPGDVLRLGGVDMRCDLYTNHQLLGLFDPEGRRKMTANALGRELKRAGFHQVNGGDVVRTARGSLRLYATRNWKERWARAKPKDCSAHYDGSFGPAAATAGNQPARGKY